MEFSTLMADTRWHARARTRQHGVRGALRGAAQGPFRSPAQEWPHLHGIRPLRSGRGSLRAEISPGSIVAPPQPRSPRSGCSGLAVPRCWPPTPASSPWAPSLPLPPIPSAAMGLMAFPQTAASRPRACPADPLTRAHLLPLPLCRAGPASETPPHEVLPVWPRCPSAPVMGCTSLPGPGGMASSSSSHLTKS